MASNGGQHRVLRAAQVFGDDVVLVKQPVRGSHPIVPVVLVRKPDGSWRVSQPLTVANSQRPKMELKAASEVTFLGKSLQ